MSRGFPSNLVYKWYSWIRFHNFAEKEFQDVDVVLRNETHF